MYAWVSGAGNRPRKQWNIALDDYRVPHMIGPRLTWQGARPHRPSELPSNRIHSFRIGERLLFRLSVPIHHAQRFQSIICYIWYAQMCVTMCLAQKRDAPLALSAAQTMLLIRCQRAAHIRSGECGGPHCVRLWETRARCLASQRIGWAVP